MPPAAGPVALVGSGEFLGAMAAVDEHLLRARPARVAVLPTAAGREGAARVRYWFDLAQRHYRALGTEVVEVPVLEAADAASPHWSAALVGVGLVYLSGGDPHHLTTVLHGSALWAAILDAWRGGAALAGCSAGAMALAGTVVPMRGHGPRPGLGVVRDACVVPHFDHFVRRASAALDDARALGVTVLGIDEEVALVSEDPAETPAGTAAGGPAGTWTVWGRSEVHVFRPGTDLDGAERYHAGQRLTL